MVRDLIGYVLLNRKIENISAKYMKKEAVD